MLWKNSDTTWQSCLIMMELTFQYGFELTFNDPLSGNYEIRFQENNPEVCQMNPKKLVISLN